MLRQELTQRDRCTLIEKNAHSGGGEAAASGVLQDGPYLLKRDPREPFDELRNLRTVFQVLEQRCDGNARSSEHPGSARAIGIALDCRT